MRNGKCLRHRWDVSHSSDHLNKRKPVTTFLIGLLIGFIAGLLVFRNNAAKAAKLEDKGKTLLDALKGK